MNEGQSSGNRDDDRIARLQHGLRLRYRLPKAKAGVFDRLVMAGADWDEAHEIAHQAPDVSSALEAFASLLAATGREPLPPLPGPPEPGPRPPPAPRPSPAVEAFAELQPDTYSILRGQGWSDERIAALGAQDPSTDLPDS